MVPPRKYCVHGKGMKRVQHGTTTLLQGFERLGISFYCEFELPSLNHLWVCPSHRLIIPAPRLFQTLTRPWDRQPISHVRGPVGARPGVHCPIPTVDLNGLTSTVCHSGMPTICITDAELSNLDEPISKSNPRGGSAWTVIGWMVSPWARIKGSIISKDLDNLSIFMWDGEVVVIHLSKSKLADLDELISKGNAFSRAYRPTPGIVVGPGSWVQGTIIPVDLGSLATLVGHREVVVINGSPTPIAQLDEAITHGNQIAAGRMCWWCGCLADLIRRYRCHLPKTAVWRPVLNFVLKKKHTHQSHNWSSTEPRYHGAAGSASAVAAEILRTWGSVKAWALHCLVVAGKGKPGQMDQSICWI